MSNKKDPSFLKDKTLGIISSYQDNCGNATYTKQIIDDLKNYFKIVECIELDQRMVHSNFYDKIKSEVINQVKKYDYINIQCEPALFHKKVRKAIKFIEEIIDARNGENISITFHSLGISQEIINLSSIQKKFFRLKLSIFKKKRKSIDIYKDMQSLILQKVKKLQQRGKNISIIVHQKELSEKLSFLKISSYFHPIVSASSADIVKFSNDNNIRATILDKYQLDKNLTYIGCYGFYGAYKGIDVAIDALKFLPENYHLILSSNCHPINNLKVRSIIINSEKRSKKSQHYNSDDSLVEQDSYMVYLMKKIINNKVFDRVHFINHIIDEEEFKQLISAIDISVFPYYEVAQQGSGPVSYSTHLSNSGKIILSRTNLFETYEKNFFKDCFTFFDQGNYLELSKKILKIKSKKDELKKARAKYNPESNCLTYVNSLIGNKDTSNFVNF